MAATRCVSCSKAIAGSDVYLRPGDASSVCARCYAFADRTCLEPPDTGGPGLLPTGNSSTTAELGASILIETVISIITD